MAVLTSGGDAPGMNAAIRSVVRTGINFGFDVYGIKQGYEGLLNGEFEQLNFQSVSDIIHRGGTMLRSSRSQQFMTEDGFNTALSALSRVGIDGLVVIGGDGSFRGAKALSESGVLTVGIPATIDNDLAYTDSTIGFDTAVNTVLNMVSQIKDTSSSHGRVVVIEVMGRNCGDIALYAGINCGAESIFVPEKEEDIAELCKRVIRRHKSGKQHSIVLIAEGAHIKSNDLVELIEDVTGVETRLSVLGYIQRGGSPTFADRMLANRMGHKAVELLASNMGGKLIGVRGNEIVDIDINEALQKTRERNTEIHKLAKTLASDES